MTMKNFSNAMKSLLFALSFMVLLGGCTAGSLTGPVDEKPDTEQSTVEPGPETNSDGVAVDPGGNHHNVSDT